MRTFFCHVVRCIPPSYFRNLSQILARSCPSETALLGSLEDIWQALRCPFSVSSSSGASIHSGYFLQHYLSQSRAIGARGWTADSSRRIFCSKSFHSSNLLTRTMYFHGECLRQLRNARAAKRCLRNMPHLMMFRQDSRNVAFLRPWNTHCKQRLSFSTTKRQPNVATVGQGRLFVPQMPSSMRQFVLLISSLFIESGGLPFRVLARWGLALVIAGGKLQRVLHFLLYRNNRRAAQWKIFSN